MTTISSIAIPRAGHIARLRGLLSRHRVVAILGMRQIGKTTLAGQAVRRTGDSVFDLENPEDRERLREPMAALKERKGTVVLDEIQRQPEVFPILRVLADRPASRARFLVLGSASPELLRQSSESLAGRVAFHELGGFSPDEVGLHRRSALWLRGGLPRSFLARSDSASLEWRREFIRTFLERDVPQFGVTIPSATIGRFWSMIAHVHGQVWNSSDFARSFGVADTTVRRYLDLLSALFVVRQLRPWHENIAKRQVKSPKIFLSDSGILHALLNLRERRDLESHPKLGASWEGFAMNAVVARLGVRWDECYFWATHAGAELDLMVVRGRRREGFEFKYSDAPRLTPSMKTALHSLKLDALHVIHPGEQSWPMAKRVRALAFPGIYRVLKPWR